MNHSPTAHRAAGFSLIELMIAITIALLLLAGMLGIVFSMRQTFIAQDNMTQMQDNQRFVLITLRNAIHDAGYYLNPANSTTTSALPATTVPAPDGTLFIDGQFITGTVGSQSDTLDVRLQTADHDGLMNCLGDTNTTGGMQVFTSSFAVNAQHQLTCAAAFGNAAAGAPGVLVDNVSAMRIQYGIDSDGDGSVDTYLSASQVNAAAAWMQVGSVRLTLSFLNLLGTPGSVQPMPMPVIETVNLMNKR